MLKADNAITPRKFNVKSADTVRLCDEVKRSLKIIYGGNSVNGVVAARSIAYIAKGNTISITACGICSQDVASMSASDICEICLEFRSIVEKIVPKESDSHDLRNILLLITLPRKKDVCYKVHSFCLRSHCHLGAITLSEAELQLIERYHRPDNYSMVYCTRYIEIDDAARNTPIKDEIFQVARKKAKAVLTTWYKGGEARLCYRGIRLRRVGVTPPRNDHGIQSLKQPKIPVRMQHESPSDAANIGHSAIKDTNQSRSLRRNLRRDFQREFYYPSQQCLEKMKCRPYHQNGCACEHKLCKKSRTQVKGFIPKKIANARVAHKRIEGAIKQSRPESKGILESETQTDENSAQIVLRPPKLHESMGHIPLEYIPGIGSQELIACKSSENLTPLQDPQMTANVKPDFAELSRLVEQINVRLHPLREHLVMFFKFAEKWDFKMFARPECSFAGWAPTNPIRYRVDCYGKDRRDYIASIAVPRIHLQTLVRLYPNVDRWFQFVDNAFELTNMPAMLTNCLKLLLCAIGARGLFELLGELTYSWTRPPLKLQFTGL